ncbi:hypothetical protein CN918_31845 [Priestia megaterium]|nr:hypothetical protein CN918_31845 [Priestia megaterium]
MIMAWEEMIKRLEKQGYDQVEHVHKVTTVYGIKGVQKNTHVYRAYDNDMNSTVRIIADCNAMKVLKVHKTRY